MEPAPARIRAAAACRRSTELAIRAASATDEATRRLERATAPRAGGTAPGWRGRPRRLAPRGRRSRPPRRRPCAGAGGPPPPRQAAGPRRPSRAGNDQLEREKRQRHDPKRRGKLEDETAAAAAARPTEHRGQREGDSETVSRDPGALRAGLPDLGGVADRSHRSPPVPRRCGCVAGVECSAGSSEAVAAAAIDSRDRAPRPAPLRPAQDMDRRARRAARLPGSGGGDRATRGRGRGLPDASTQGIRDGPTSRPPPHRPIG